MNILITGANGFVGRHLVRRLLRTGRIDAGQAPFSRLTLVDLGADDSVDDARVRLEAIRRTHPFVLREVDIEADDALFKRYLERIPVVALDGEELFELFVDDEILRQRL